MVLLGFQQKSYKLPKHLEPDAELSFPVAGKTSAQLIRHLHVTFLDLLQIVSVSGFKDALTQGKIMRKLNALNAVSKAALLWLALLQGFPALFPSTDSPEPQQAQSQTMNSGSLQPSPWAPQNLPRGAECPSICLLFASLHL